MELRFVASDSAYTMAAACRLLAGETLPDAELAAALAPGVAALGEVLASRRIALAQAAAHLIPQAASIGSNLDLAKVVKRKLGAKPVDEIFREGLVRAFTALEAATARVRPQLTDELAELAGRLELRWKAAGGPHLLATIARWTEPLMIAPAATVLAGCPGLGPASQALLHYNTVLYCPADGDDGGHLLDAAHLAYLLAQLQVDVPIYADRLVRTGPEQVASLAMVPLTLAALAEFAPPQRPLVVPATPTADDAMLDALAAGVSEATIGLWLAQCGREADAVCYAEPLASWWAAYAEGGGSWEVALAALDRLIADAAEPAPVS